MATQIESANSEQVASENSKSFDLLEKYRTTVYGSTRNDFTTVEATLFSQANKLDVVCKAVKAIEKETTDDDSIGALMGVSDMLSEIVQTMNQALSLLEDCELKRG